MTNIYLIRHAEAEGNLYRRSQGHFDGKITPLGYQQIAALAERFRTVALDALYSSDLSRARTTAGAIEKYHPELELTPEPRLREICMGVWEDRAFGDLAHENPEQMAFFSNDPDKWRVEGSETFPALIRRIRSIILELAARHEGQTIAVVSHGMAIRSFLSHVQGLPSTDQIPHGDNTAVSLLHVEGEQVEIEYYNDNSHLSEEVSTFAKQSWWKQKDGKERENMRFAPLDLTREEKLYTECYADAWIAAHGDPAGFEPELYVESAGEHCAQYPEALMKAMVMDMAAGVVELDPDRCAGEGAGWITLVYMRPEYRGRRMGIQLIGHAAAFYRKLGRKSVRLNVAKDNVRAIRFYETYGFQTIGEQQGVRDTLLIMEKSL